MTSPPRLLVLGGTSWLGGRVAGRAHARGLSVSCLARGVSGSTPPGVRHVKADRTRPDAYDAVAGEDWDAVVDVSRQPEQVRSALTALAPRTRHWVFVSTISVYADHDTPGDDEDAALLPAWTARGEAPPEAYGEAKVACEEACRRAIAQDRLLVARAGLLAGDGDRSDRFGYWPARAALTAVPGRERVLVPPTDSPVQVLDVDDLAAWLVDAVLHRTGGVVDAVGEPCTLGDVLAASARAAGTHPRPVPADEGWLERHGVAPWMGPDSLPLWLPRTGYAGHATRRRDRAAAAGLRTRPLDETAAAALRWERSLGLDRERAAGLGVGREAALLAALARNERPPGTSAER